jgi:hypothetical protein
MRQARERRRHLKNRLLNLPKREVFSYYIFS